MADSETGPPEREAPFLQFHQLTRLKIFDDKPETLTPKERSSLLAVSNKYGYTFIGCISGLKVLRTSEISKCHNPHDPSPNTSVTNYNCSKKELNAKPVHLSLNAENLILSVCTVTDTGLTVVLFDVLTLVQKGENALPFSSTPLSKESNIQLVNLLWNPVNPCCFATCLSDGSMTLWDCSGDSIKKAVELPSDIQIKAMCWSPKGKQIVLGTKLGELIQYNQKLEPKRFIKPPDFSDEVKVVDILWLSTYMFAVAYIDVEEQLHPNLNIVNAPKEGPTTYSNFEDICYGSGQSRAPQYQLQIFDKWCFMVATSSNALDAAVLGQSPDNKSSWAIWSLDDSSRLELPLSTKDEETFPMGMALDLTSESSLTIGNKTYQPPPLLMVLSTEGVLCPFYVLNSEASETVTVKAQPLPLEGGRVAVGRAVPTQPQASKPAAPPQTAPPAIPQTTPQAHPRVPPDPAKPVEAFTYGPIHKSSSTGSFAQSNTASSSTFLAKTTPTDRSASLSFNAPKVPTTTSGPTNFGSGGLFGKTQPSPSSSSPSIFSFGSKGDESKGGSAFGQNPFPFVAPKAVPASTSLVSGGTQGVLSEQGRQLQQPASAQTTVSNASSLIQPTPQATLPSGSLGTQPAGSLASDHLKSQFPMSASSSAFSVSQQKMPTGANAFGGGVQQTDSVKAAHSAPSLKTPAFGHQPSTQSSAGKETLGTEPKAQPFSFAPPNQVAPHGAMQLPTQAHPSRPGFPPNQVAPQPGYPAQVTLSAVGSRPPPPVYGGQPKQQPGQAVSEHKPTSSVQAPSAEAAAEESGTRPRGKGSFSGSAVDFAYLSNIKEEMEHFMKESAELQNHTKRAHFRVGDRSELENMKKSIDDLLKFRTEVLDVTKSHNEEIHEMKTKFLATFAQLEDARIRKQRNNDPRYLQLLKSRGLDPQTAQQLRNIQSKYHYLKTGLGDVNSCLDAQWEEFHQRKSQREGRKLGTPMMDTIYQTLSHHYNILITQRGKLEELRQQLIQARRYDISEAPWERGILQSPPDRSGNLSSLAAKLSSTTISSPMKNKSTPVSLKKQAQLRKALTRRATTPRRTASKVDISDMSSPIHSYASDGSLAYAFANRRLQFQEEDPVENPASSRQSASFVDSPDVRIGRGINQARQGGSMERVAPPSQALDGKRSEPSSNIGRKSATTPISPPPSVEKPPSSTPILPETTSPSSFTHSGRGTVVWGTKTTPVKTPPSSSTRATAPGPTLRKVSEKSSDLPPVVNVKNLEAMRESMPPPITFAPVCSTIDEGTAKVINQVLAEITNTSGYAQPESSDQNERRVSFSDEPPPIAQPVPPSKPMIGASKTSAMQPLAPSTSAIPPSATSSAIPTSATSVGRTFGSPGSLFGTKRDSSSTAVSNATVPNSSGSITSKGTLPSFQGLPSSTTAPKQVAEPVTFGGGSSGFFSTSLQQNAPSTGVKPNLFDFKDQKTAASTSTPGGFFAASTMKEPSQDPSGTAVAPGVASVASTTPTEAPTMRPSQNLNFGVKSIVTAPPSTSIVEPTATVAPAAGFSSSSSLSQAPAKQSFSGTGSKSAGSAPSGLKQLLRGGDDEAGTGLAKLPSSGLGLGSATQAVGEDEAGTGQRTFTPNASDTIDNPTSATGSMTSQTATAAAATTTVATGLFGKTVTTPAEESSGTSGGLFGPKAGGTSVFGATSTASTSSGPTSGFGTSPFGATFGASTAFGKAPTTEATGLFGKPVTTPAGASSGTSGGLFGAQPFGASSSTTGFSFGSVAASAPTTSAPADTIKTKTPSLFGLLKEDTPTSSTTTPASSSSLFGSTTSGSTSSSLFGQPPSVSSSSGLFGQPATTPGLFGQPASTASTGGQFGQSSSTSSSGVGLFGQLTSTTSSSGVAFGQTSTPGASMFQQTSSSGPFGQSSAFGQQPSGGLFGQAPNQAPAFGQGPSIFAQPSSATPTSSSVFGAGGDGGGMFSGLGGQPNPEAARTNPFETSANSGTFGTATGNTSIFGGQGATSFSSGASAISTNTASVFGGGFTSPTGGGVAKSGFGVTQQTTASGGFGAAPSFGSPPGFGNAPSFGSSTFGNTAGFGSSFGQPSAFGASPSTATSSMPPNGFSGFANQETLTFGSLSTSTTQQPEQGFGGFVGAAPQPGFGSSGFGNNTNTSSGGFSGSSSFMQYR